MKMYIVVLFFYFSVFLVQFVFSSTTLSFTDDTQEQIDRDISGNITDTFKGTWIHNGPLSEIGFLNHEGNFVLSISNTKTDLSRFDLVEGEVSIRDGKYSNDGSYKYSVQGVYLWEKGRLFLVANPISPSFSVIQDYSISFNNYSTLDESTIEETFRNFGEAMENGFALDDNHKTDKKGQYCYFKIFINFEKNVDQSIREIDNGYFTIDKPFHKLSGNLRSPNCNITANVTAESILLEHYYRKATNYVLMVIIVGVIQVFILLGQLDHTTTQSAAAAVSPFAIGAQAILDAYICLGHLTAAIYAEKLFNIFAIAAFIKFVLFSVFELRYMLQVWKAAYPEAFRGGWQAAQQEITSLYIKFYGILVCMFVLQYWAFTYGLLNTFVFLGYSFWVPQIIHSAFFNSQKPLTLKYIVGMTVTRLALPLYFEGCPANFAHIEPTPKFLFILVFWVYFQGIILLLQHFVNPQFFIPTSLLPRKYDYYRPMELPVDTKCAICWSEVDGAYVVTPCDHFFHERCLRQWLDLKLECPTCRRTTPSLPAVV